MAARYTEVTLEDMERFLKRAYRALRPKRGESRGEVYYDLNLSRGDIFIRVWTSIRPRSGSGAGVGEDAIRVTMITKGGKPLVPKGKIVKRTQNWKTSLQDRIETLLEDYEAKIEYWRGRQHERDEGSKEEPKEEEAPVPPSPSGLLEGTFTRLQTGEWGAKIRGKGSPGAKAKLTTKRGSKPVVTLIKKVWSGQDRYEGGYVEMWTIEEPSRKAADEDEPRDLVSVVADRYLAGVQYSGE